MDLIIMIFVLLQCKHRKRGNSEMNNNLTLYVSFNDIYLNVVLLTSISEQNVSFILFCLIYLFIPKEKVHRVENVNTCQAWIEQNERTQEYAVV